MTAALLAAAADIISQRLASRRARLNWRRTLSIALYGAVWVGPSNHFWQLFLERLFPRHDDPLRPAKKVAVDQLTYGPLNNVLFMTYISMVVEGRSVKATRAKLTADYRGVQVNGWRLWPLAQLVNHSFVPLDLRVLWSNCVSLLWTTFMIMRSRAAAGARGARIALPLLKTD